MRNLSSLRGGVALGVLLALGAGAGAQAKPVKKHHKVERVRVATDSALEAKVASLTEAVSVLENRLNQEEAARKATEVQAQTAQADAAQARSDAQAAHAQLEQQIQTIPGDVQTAVAAAAPKTDKLYIKGVSVQLGGFLAAEGVYRSKAEEADIASSFSGIPFPNSVLGRTAEDRFTARQSRVTALIQGDVSPTIHLAGYGEVDFLGAAQTANSNETNSYTPRIRVMYGTVNWDDDNGGWQFLAGQNWSLATEYSKGLSPRSEMPPSVIDAQYVPGFVFTRQPQLRITRNWDNQFFAAVSLENPQTTFYNSGHLDSGLTLTTNGAAGSGFNSANTLSLNHAPDVIAKVATDQDLQGHAVHAELFGLYRDFYSRLNNAGVATNNDVSGGGVGGAISIGVIPKILDVQFSGADGTGIGRYGAGQLPDATVSFDGTLHPIREYALLAGATLHAMPTLDIYAYAGEEHAKSAQYTNGTIFNGLGNINYDNSGCETEGASNCTANTQKVEQLTIGFWHKPFAGPYGHFQWGLQYSYTERHAFYGIGGAPETGENMIMYSFRYYPFN